MGGCNQLWLWLKGTGEECCLPLASQHLGGGAPFTGQTMSVSRYQKLLWEVAKVHRLHWDMDTNWAKRALTLKMLHLQQVCVMNHGVRWRKSRLCCTWQLFGETEHEKIILHMRRKKKKEERSCQNWSCQSFLVGLCVTLRSSSCFTPFTSFLLPRGYHLHTKPILHPCCTLHQGLVILLLLFLNKTDQILPLDQRWATSPPPPVKGHIKTFKAIKGYRESEFFYLT